MTGEEKLATCRHRSIDKEAPSDIVFCCGAKAPVAGYYCWKLSLDSVTEEDCGPCKFYQPRTLFSAGAGNE